MHEHFVNRLVKHYFVLEQPKQENFLAWCEPAQAIEAHETYIDLKLNIPFWNRQHRRLQISSKEGCLQNATDSQNSIDVRIWWCASGSFPPYQGSVWIAGPRRSALFSSFDSFLKRKLLSNCD
jgi:hypothetical protein